MHMFAGLEACTNKYNAARLGGVGGVSCELQSGTPPYYHSWHPNPHTNSDCSLFAQWLNEDTKL